MKFKNLTITVCTAFALIACNNNIDGVIDRENENNDEPKQLVVSINLPETQNSFGKRSTRGIIGDTDSNIPTIVLTNGTAYIKNKNGVIEDRINFDRDATKKNILSGEGNDFKVILKSNKITENGTIFITFNNGTTSFSNISIKDIQPESKKYNAENAVYNGTGIIAKKSKTRANDITEFTASITATSIVSRVQAFGQINFDKRMCKSVNLAYASPVSYTKTYFGYSNGNKPELKDIVDEANNIENILGLGAAYSKLENNLLKLFTSSNGEFKMSEFTPINNGNKAITNHVFKKNEAKFYIGLYTESYYVKRNNEFEILDIAPKLTDKEIESNKTQESWYVYYKTSEKNESELYTIKADSKTYKVTYDATKKEYTVADKPEDVTLGTEANVRYHTLKGFGVKEDGIQVVTKDAYGKKSIETKNGVLCYEGGKIYKIDLNTLPWKGVDGTYRPDTDPGREDVDNNDKKSTLEVNITVKDWSFAEMKDLTVSDDI